MKSKPVYMLLIFVMVAALGCSLDIRDEEGYQIFWLADIPPSMYLVQSHDSFLYLGRSITEGISESGNVIENNNARVIEIRITHQGKRHFISLDPGQTWVVGEGIE